jgi:hypothetical protein
MMQKIVRAEAVKQELQVIESQQQRRVKWHKWTAREKAEQQVFSFLGKHFFTSETRGLIWYQPEDWR